VNTLSENVVGSAEVLFYEKEKPGMGKGLFGQLILTNQRIVYVKYLEKSLLRREAKDYTSNIEEGLRNEGSLAIPVGQINEAKAERTWGTPYLKIRYLSSLGEKACSFIFRTPYAYYLPGVSSGGVSLRKGPIEELAKTIEQLKKEASARY